MSPALPVCRKRGCGLPVAMFVLALMAIPVSHAAICHRPEGATLTFTLPPVILPDHPIAGALLAERSLPLSVARGGSSTDCNRENDTLTALQTHPGWRGGGLAKTEIPGIGYRLLLDGEAFPLRHPLNDTTGSLRDSVVTLQLVATGRSFQNGGRLAGGRYGLLLTGKGRPAVNVRLSPVILRQAACSIAGGPLLVRMAPLSTGELPVPGTTGKPTTFILPLRCRAPARVSLLWEGATEDGNMLALNRSPDSAHGLAIRLEYHQHVVPLNHPIALLPGDTDVTFSARYVRTGSVLTPGRGDAMATVTLWYE